MVRVELGPEILSTEPGNSVHLCTQVDQHLLPWENKDHMSFKE